VINTALLLFFGWQPHGGLLWVMFSPWQENQTALLLIPSAINLCLWVLADLTRRKHQSSFTPRWIARLALAFAFVFLTWTGVDAVTGLSSDLDGLALLLTLGLETAVGVYVQRRRDDVFPLALIAGSLIVISTCALGSWADLKETGMFFVLALWLVASSTISGRMLMSRVRQWRALENVT